MGVEAEDVRLLRRLLLDELRQKPAAWSTLPPALVRIVDGLTHAEIRTALVLVATRCQAAGALSVADARLWIESSGLGGIRVGVRALATRLRLSTRQAHRRIQHCDRTVARQLSSVAQETFGELVRAAGPTDRSELELVETARAECLLLPDSERRLDALTMYRRNRRPRGKTGSTYLAGNKDTRYRDANRVKPWLDALATDPPLPATTAEDEGVLLVCRGVELTDDPHQAIAQVNLAIWNRQRDALPVLLANAGRLIPDIGAAGVDLWLSYLQLRYHAAMESENIAALRYARAWQVDAARYSPLGIADPRVARGMSGRGHILQMFGHYDAAIRCFAAAARHATHFHARGEESGEEHLLHRESLQNARAQLVYTEVLRNGNRAKAIRAMRGVHAVADTDDRIEVQFTRERRSLELALGFAVRRNDLAITTPSRRHAQLVEQQFGRFVTMAADHPSPNRLLAAHDITLLYAVLTRDAELAHQARDAFERVNETMGGYANLTDRFNSRLRAAKSLSTRFRDIPEASGPADPLRRSHATPTRATGLLVAPDHAASG